MNTRRTRRLARLMMALLILGSVYTVYLQIVHT